jgi:hypothetical protein
MAAAQLVNPNAEVTRRAHALMINVNAAIGLQEVLKTNLGESRFKIGRSLRRPAFCLPGSPVPDLSWTYVTFMRRNSF